MSIDVLVSISKKKKIKPAFFFFNKHASSAVVFFCYIIILCSHLRLFLIRKKEKIFQNVSIFKLCGKKVLGLTVCVAAGTKETEVLEVWHWNTD